MVRTLIQVDSHLSDELSTAFPTLVARPHHESTTLVGIAIMRGQVVGYMPGILIAGLGAIFSFAFLPYYPVWSLLIVALNVLVLWALCSQIAHDRVDLSDVEGPL